MLQNIKQTNIQSVGGFVTTKYTIYKQSKYKYNIIHTNATWQYYMSAEESSNLSQW